MSGRGYSDMICSPEYDIATSEVSSLHHNSVLVWFDLKLKGILGSNI